jgi:hypothetical protein
VMVGSASLPNGILSSAIATLADDHPKTFVVQGGRVLISLRSRENGRPPFENYYLHGWRPGTEWADVFLTFGIDEFEPGATLQVRNLVVE